MSMSLKYTHDIFIVILQKGTMFEPVVDYVQQGTRVAIASVGGLGTAGIKFAKSFGGHVTALSRGEGKREKAMAAGADEFYACLGDADAMGKLAGKFDLIIDSKYLCFFEWKVLGDC